jgi:hypothetical protein
MYLYRMTKRLVNVRLDEEYVRKVRALRREGVVLSDLVREAIDIRYDALVRAEAPLDAGTLITEIFEAHPDPADLPPRDYDVADARAGRAAIRQKLGGRRA